MDVSGVVICPEISGPTSGGATMAPEVDVASLIASPQYKWLRDDVVKISNSVSSYPMHNHSFTKIYHSLMTYIPLSYRACPLRVFKSGSIRYSQVCDRKSRAALPPQQC